MSQRCSVPPLCNIWYWFSDSFRIPYIRLNKKAPWHRNKRNTQKVQQEIVVKVVNFPLQMFANSGKNILKMDCLRSLQADDLPHRMWNPTATCVFKTLTGQFTVLQFCGTLSYLRYLRSHLQLKVLAFGYKKDNDAAMSKNSFKTNRQ